MRANFNQFGLSDKQIFIKSVEKALGFPLKPWQIDYIFFGKDYPVICPCLMDGKPNENIINWHNCEYIPGEKCRSIGRQTGRTTAYIIKLLLFEKEPVKLRNIEKYSDRSERSYAENYFKHRFIHYYQLLSRGNIPTVQVIF